MNMDQRVLAGVGGLLAGAVLAYAAGSSTRADLEAQVAQRGEVLTSVAALEAGIAALDSAVARLDARVDAGLLEMDGRLGDLAAATADDSALQDLAARVDGLSGDLADAGAEMKAAIGADLEGLLAQVAALTPAAPAAPVEVVASAALPAPSGSEIRIGQTLQLADGMRVFLSSFDPVAQTARVAMNGYRTSNVSLNQAAASGDCSLTLTGFGQGTASFVGDCNAPVIAAPAAVTTPEPALIETAASASGQLEATPVRIGQTAQLADGAMRVFLSSVDAEQGVARIAANGRQTMAVAAGVPVVIGDCSVTMLHAEGRSAAFAADCGASTLVPVTAVAPTAPIGEGASLRVGQTATLEDGLRVFLSALDADEGTARVAINGTQLSTLAVALPHMAGDCTLQLREVAGGQATLAGSC